MLENNDLSQGITLIKEKRINEIRYFYTHKAKEDSRKIIGDLLAEREMLTPIVAINRKMVEYYNPTHTQKTFEIPLYFKDELLEALQKYIMNDNFKRETENHLLAFHLGRKPRRL